MASRITHLQGNEHMQGSRGAISRPTMPACSCECLHATCESAALLAETPKPGILLGWGGRGILPLTPPEPDYNKAERFNVMPLSSKMFSQCSENYPLKIFMVPFRLKMEGSYPWLGSGEN